jgi:selenocysteine lyase/cysteine desulfurase
MNNLPKNLQNIIENSYKKKYNTIFTHFNEKFKEIKEAELKQIIYPCLDIKTPFGKKSVVYADFIASGKPCPIIENYITKNIYTRYSNTHSNNNYGICMKNEIKKVRQIIKNEYSLNDDYEILFKGSGVTDCINYLINCLDYSQYLKIHIFISSYEHYSNHLPWVELSKQNTSIKLYIIPLTDHNELDVLWYYKKISSIFKKASKEKTLIITSIVHCSNLTGYFTPIYKIKQILNSFEKTNVCKYFFCDIACSAPYIQKNLSFLDAFFISPHKFIGGVETPGLLIAKTCLFHKNHSLNPGGSCIKTTHNNNITYSNDIEVRESAGTPNIIGIIKMGQCFLLKKYLFHLIKYNENCLCELIEKWYLFFEEKYKTFKYIKYKKQKQHYSSTLINCNEIQCNNLGSSDIKTIINQQYYNTHFLPIFSFNITNLHYNLVVVLLNDIFGIQTRGGKVCTGLFNDHVKHKYNIDGFCRISLHWSMSKKQIHYIFNAINFVIEHGEKFKKYYDYCKDENLFYCK